MAPACASCPAWASPPLRRLRVSQGNTTTPYTFTVVISNTDYLTPTGPLSLTLQVPGNFYYVGNTAAAQSQVSGTLAVVQPLVDQAAGKPAQVVVRANPETQTLPPGDVVTVTYRLAATTSGAPNPTLTNTLAISGEAGGMHAAVDSQHQLLPAARAPAYAAADPALPGELWQRGRRRIHLYRAQYRHDHGHRRQL